MKATLEFTLPEENQEFETAANASQLASVITDFDRYIRNLRKYDNNLESVDKVLDQLHMELWALVNQYSVQDLVQMVATNDITGDIIISKPPSDLYRKNWDQVFGWISVDERLPESSEDVTVKTRSGETYEAYLCKCKAEWRCPFSGSSVLLDITHWKPL